MAHKEQKKAKSKSIKILFAPIRGVNTAAFRNIYMQYFSGIDIYYAPFIPTTNGTKISQSHIKEILPENNKSNAYIVPQLIGNNPEDFVRMANKITEYGYDTINWNLGCPMPTITNKRRGSGLLPFPQQIADFLEVVNGNLNCLFSIKVRLGYNAPDELFNLMPVFNDYELKELIIHARTGSQRYAGEVDLPTFDKCIDSCRHPVIYNGDITNRNFFTTIQTRYSKMGSYMIGRGIITDPFLPEKIKDYEKFRSRSYDEVIKTIETYHNHLYSEYQELLFGPAPVLGRMKELWFYLAQSIENGDKILKKVQKSTSLKKFEQVVKDVFSGEFILKESYR